MNPCGAATLSGLLLLVEDDEQVSRALGTEGQHDGLQDGRQDGQGQQQGPQIVGAQDRLQAENLERNKKIGTKHIQSSQRTSCATINGRGEIITHTEGTTGRPERST